VVDHPGPGGPGGPVDASIGGGEDSCRSLDCARDDTSIHAATSGEVGRYSLLRWRAVGVEGRGGGGEPGVGVGGGRNCGSLRSGGKCAAFGRDDTSREGSGKRGLRRA